MEEAQGSVGEAQVDLDPNALNALLDLELADWGDVGGDPAEDQLGDLTQLIEAGATGEGTAPASVEGEAGSTAGEADAVATPGEGVEAGVEAADVSDEGDDQMAEEGGGAEQPETEAEEVEAKGSQGTDNDREELDKRAKVMLAMNEEQLNRYDAYRNSALPRPKIKRLLQQLMGVAPTEKATIAMCGIGKLFVGEVVEMARYLAGLEGYHGPLLPRHIQRAYQQLDAAQRVPHTSTRLKRLFR